MSVVMGKEASLEGLEFDGDTVLCRVCGDKASGFHYGVHACEGCKGFFRRSIQQKIQYRPCLKNQQCNIMRVNRNRCQYCRLKKCIAVGMSRDAVRFGRVPKKEKARIIEQMQKSNLQMVATAMTSALSTQDLVQTVKLAHRQTCDLGPEKAKVMREIALLQNDYVDCPAHMACPVNYHAGVEMTDNQDWTDFSEFFAPAIKSVVDFAKLIPGFLLLNQDDQITLLKAATFEVLLVRLACLFDTESNTMMFANGKLFRRQTAGLSTSVGFLLDSMFDFADRFNKLNLNDDELALFSAVVLLSPDRPGLRQIDQVEKIQGKLTESLQNMINTNHKEDNTLFAKLVMKTTDLRTLNALHAEKTVGQNEEGNNDMQDSQIDARSEDSTTCDSLSSSLTQASSLDASMYDSNNSLIHAQSRYGEGGPSHSQVVLKTPYGMFLREDGGYYGMVQDQPRRRCHTLDRDSQISRPRLHTIEEGTRRRYTMDREYLSKMVGKLSDKLEKRAHVNSMPGSVNNSAASSPVPIFEEQYSHMNRNFIPISTPDSSACSSRTSPSFHRDTLQPFSSSPNSPRPRSGSIGTDDIGPMRPRCASFHVNSEGHAAQGRPYTLDHDFLSADGQLHRMNADMRRGSIGASYNLHAKKKSLLVDRHPAYLAHIPDASLFRTTETQRSPLANEDSSKRHNISSDGSAFEQVPHLTVPLTLPWGSNLPRSEVSEPPKVSVTAPIEDQPQTQTSNSTISNPNWQERGAGPIGSSRSSPDEEMENASEDIFHKKFDKFRKFAASHTAMDETRKMEKLSINDMEAMESDDVSNDIDSGRKTDRDKSPLGEKTKMSATEAHPQLLAQLKSGPQFKPLIHPAFPTVSAGPTFIPHPLQQNGSNTSSLSVGGISPNEKKSGSLSPNNVVLSVPQTPFGNRSPNISPTAGPSSGQSLMDNHPCIQNILSRRDNTALPSVNTQFLSVDNNKDATPRKVPSSENLTKVENDPSPPPPNFRNGHAAPHPVMFTGFGPRPGGYDPAQYLMYQQLYLQHQQQGIRVPQYNEHLAGMQQMVYGGNPQQLRRSSGGETPLNLTQVPVGSEASETSSGNTELIQKIKEEVIS